MNDRPFLSIGPPDVGPIPAQPPRPQPQLNTPGAARQSERLTGRFAAIATAIESGRIRSEGDTPESDPELVVVFDLAGTVDGFKNAVARIPGLEFLNEYVDDDLEPDDDFFTSTREGPTGKPLRHSLYVVMSNSAAIDELIRMFRDWESDQDRSFPHGLGRFKSLFKQLQDIRRWSAVDRIRDTGLLEQWREDVQFVGGATSTVKAEIEIWYRNSAADRSAAQQSVIDAVAEAGGSTLRVSQIASIAYHAVLAELPIQTVEAVLADGPDAISLMNTDSIMFMSPYRPMSADLAEDEPEQTAVDENRAAAVGLPRIGLLDGLPFSRHTLLSDRLVIDDPDDLGRHYGVSTMRHGTAMASLILHGDLSAEGPSLGRPLYVRPILVPDDQFHTERTPADELLPDLLHRAIRRMFEGDGDRPPQAPSVRILNLSIGVPSRAFVRRISPLARLVDWAAVAYNLLIVVSAGNYDASLEMDGESFTTLQQARRAALAASFARSRLRGLLPPGEAINVLTVGSVHADGSGDLPDSDTVWELTHPGFPSLYSAVGPGFRRSVKPELFHTGGRALHVRPISGDGDTVAVQLARTEASGPGTKVAAPGWSGEVDRVAYSHGTSIATALVTREADSVFSLLESLQPESGEFAFPNAQYHPVLARALLVHASSWRLVGGELAVQLNLPADRRRKELTRQLGYGVLDVERLTAASTSRAVLIGAGSIQRNQRQTFRIPKPASIRSRAEQHRITITLAVATPTSGHLQRYRGARVFFQTPEEGEVGGTRAESDNHAARNGTCQHEIFEGASALAFEDGDAWSIDVDCRDDALSTLTPIRFGLVVSVEVAPSTSELVHDEIRDALRTRFQQQLAEQIRIR